MSQPKHYSKYVPDVGDPTKPIWFIGEAPGEEEENTGEPFVGRSGQMLMNCLARNGLMRSDVYLGNLFHYRPWDNKFENIGTAELLQSVNDLYQKIKQYKPVVLVPLGNQPLKYLTGKNVISHYRGSILPCIIEPSIKSIPTYHPSYVSRDESKYPIFDIDVKRIVQDSQFRDFNLPEYNFIINPTGLDRELWTQKLEEAEWLSIDIETVKSSSIILCVGFGLDEKTAVVFAHTSDNRIYIQRGLSSKSKKILQNGTFDYLQLLDNGYELLDPAQPNRPYTHDTLQAAHASDPELPKSLEYLCSVYTRQPYYKGSGRANIPEDSKSWGVKVNKDELYKYNGTDCCITYTVAMTQLKEGIEQNTTYQFEMECLTTAMNISRAGLLIDTQRRDLMKFSILKNLAKRQALFNALAGWQVNVKSTPDMKKLLYEQLGLPVQRNRDRRVTCDEDAIVRLITLCKDKVDSYKREENKTEWRIKLTLCQQILKIRGLRQLISTYLSKEPGVDGRIHSHFKIQTETGRWNCSKYVDGSGFNAQTLPRDPLEIADEDIAKDAEGNLRLLEELTQEDEEEQEEAA